MLKPRKRITKKELKQDTLVTYVFMVNDYFTRHKNKILYWGIGIIAAAVLMIIVITSSRETELEAVSRVGQVEFLYTHGQFKEATAEFLKITNEYSGTDAAGLAAFYLANCYFYTNEFDEAKRHYQQYIDDYGSDPDITASAYAGIAACLENNKQYEDAVIQYRKAVEKNQEGFAVPQYLIDIARCLRLMGNNDEARANYQEIIEKYEKTPFQRRAEELMAQF